MKTRRIAIFASGTGSNARKIVEYFKGNEHVKVALIVSNKKDAPVLEMAVEYSIATCVLTRSIFYEPEGITATLKSYNIDFIALAGFLWLVPTYLTEHWQQKIVNIHPALLPAYGGKGMYGMSVHQAVWEAKEAESGITIHYVNEFYDSGDIIFQAKCNLLPTDTPADIAKKVLQLEHRYYPRVIEEILC